MDLMEFAIERCGTAGFVAGLLEASLLLIESEVVSKLFVGNLVVRTTLISNNQTRRASSLHPGPARRLFCTGQSRPRTE
jgi:hypothetical protein